MERREEDEDTKALAQTEDGEEQDEEEKREDGDFDDDEEEEEGAAADRRDDEDKDVGDKDAVEVKEKKKVKNVFQDRKCVPGIIYLGHIPPRFRPKQLRNLLSVYGEIGRIFLQPEGTSTTRTHTDITTTV